MSLISDHKDQLTKIQRWRRHVLPIEGCGVAVVAIPYPGFDRGNRAASECKGPPLLRKSIAAKLSILHELLHNGE